MIFAEQYPLLSHNTFGISATARYFAEYACADELRQALSQVPQGTPLLHIGGGSNLLFLNDFPGLVLHGTNTELEVLSESDTEVVVRVGAGMVWDDLVALTLEHGWYGLENLSLIPGEVGASAVQNIGAYGAEAADYIVEANCLHLRTGECRVWRREECQYGYRQSIFKTPEQRGQWAVLSVSYRLHKQFVPHVDYGGIRTELERRGIALEQLTASQLRQVIIDIRQAKLPDPKVQGNAGSFFMNPVVPRAKYEELAAQYPTMPHYEVDAEHMKIPAGWMIDQCGWKGRALGPAAVHQHQALVLVNLGGAQGADIVALCEAVRADVRDRFGIEIHPEVNFIG